MVRKIDRRGQRFGSLTVISESGQDKGGWFRWTCKCDCGNITDISSQCLTRKRRPKRHCGCQSVKRDYTEFAKRQIKNLSGKKFGKLTVLEYYKVNNRIKWICLCECGNLKKNVSGISLQNGSTQSCGCIRLHKGSKCQGAINRLYRSYKRSSKHRQMDLLLSQDEFIKLTSDICYYCGTEPTCICRNNKFESSYYIYNGIDRIDNNIGYIIDNCVTCCKICNRSKGTLGQNEFLGKIEKIYNNLVNKCLKLEI